MVRLSFKEPRLVGPITPPSKFELLPRVRFEVLEGLSWLP